MSDNVRKCYRRRRGAALAYVILAFVLVTMFSVFVAYLVSMNLNQAKNQEKNLQAYYLSLSGTDLCMAALTQEGAGGEDDTLLYDLFNPAIANPVTLTDDLSLDSGTVNLTVSAITLDGERWIQIVAVATLEDQVTDYTSTLQFKYSEPRVQIKS